MYVTQGKVLPVREEELTIPEMKEKAWRLRQPEDQGMLRGCIGTSSRWSGMWRMKSFGTQSAQPLRTPVFKLFFARMSWTASNIP